MRRIVIISHKFPPVNSGYGNQAQAVLKKIIASSSDLYFIVLTAKYHNKESQNSNNQGFRIKYLWHRLIPVSTEQISFINYSIFQIQAFLWLLFNNRQYQVIHCLASGPHYALAVIAGKFLKKKVIVKIANERFFKINEYFLSDSNIVNQTSGFRVKTPNFNKQRMSRGQLRTLLRVLNGYFIKKIVSADLIIVINESIMNHLIARNVCPKKIVKIPNGVDSNKFFPAKSKQEKNLIRKKLNIEENAVVIFFAGVLSYVKGIQDLVETMKIIRPRQNTLLLVCGEDGGYGHELNKSFAEINKLENLRAEYKGKVKNLDEYYRATDIFVLPSYIEGLPNVLLEAAMSGLPLIASDIGGNRDIIEYEPCGILFPPGNIELLKQALETLIYDQRLRVNFGKKARKIALKKYHLSSVAEQYMQLYRKFQ